jgi:hypothetical protein
VTPDADVTNPQAAACARCERGWSQVGGLRRRKRLAVLIIPSLTQRIMGPR